MEGVSKETSHFLDSVRAYAEYTTELENKNKMIPDCPTTDKESVKNDVPLAIRQEYNLAFEDVFIGQSALDPLKWRSSLPWGPDLTINREEEYYIDTLGGQGWQPGINPFSFGPNGLIITAAPITGTKPVTTNGITGGQNYYSGVLTTRDSISIRGGFTEICMKPPCGADGSWPAAWLLNALYYQNAALKNDAENGGTGNDKFNPEIDWPEFVTGGSNPGTLCAKPAYHYFSGDRTDTSNYSLWTLDSNNFIQRDANTYTIQTAGNVYQDCATVLQTSLPDVCELDYCQDFHTYGIHWEPNDFIHFYLDGQIVACINGFDNIISDQAMYFIMNLAVGGSFPFGNTGQLADPTTYPAQLEIEYVRIYTK